MKIVLNQRTPTVISDDQFLDETDAMLVQNGFELPIDFNDRTIEVDDEELLPQIKALLDDPKKYRGTYTESFIDMLELLDAAIEADERAIEDGQAHWSETGSTNIWEG